ncbi:hypothetical protein BO79DRAFT_224017 [Aspergillus costaricaensis CBS 115574]|uniref:Uncharacterized protein n=1 Tax=Aspergillus costaricaensis CBS 115574 TaxID=1448317 RepID=A0ACD1ISU3_9EURO|nr:hypothetical protein BO79DRAFT_224017 [Aspergillus costaricaensis CBS 115574]RAK93550.1 hypothetical protein BO79DRAFT_224017 [Aspergillus costaricaensis CBS 115574]
MAVGLACQSYMSTRQCSEPYQGVRKRFRVRNRLSGKLIKMVFVFRSRQGNISQGMGDMIPCSPHPAHHFPDKDRSNLEIRGYEVPHFVSLRGWCIPEECIAELIKASSAWVYGLANKIGQHTLRISLNDDVGANTLMDRENKVMSMQYDGVTSGCSTGIFSLRFFECLYAQ